jgi:hypothetical protein
MKTGLMEKCRKHWQQLNIKDRKGLKAAIDQIFEAHTNQSDALVEIYKLVFPEWDAIEKINGFPKAGAELWKYICRGFMAFDRKHHPNVFNGGIWMNTGFTSNTELGPWEISFDNCTVEYMAKSA